MKGGTQRERKGQTNRQKEKERENEREREIERERETDRQTETETETEWERDRQTDKQTFDLLLFLPKLFSLMDCRALTLDALLGCLCIFQLSRYLIE